MSATCTTGTALRTSTFPSPATRCKVQLPVLRQKTPQRLSQQRASNAGREPERHPVQKRRLPTDEIPNVLEGQIRMAREASECYRRQGFEAITKNDSLKSPLLVIDGKPKEFHKP